MAPHPPASHPHPPSPSSTVEGLKHSRPQPLCPKDSFRLDDPAKLCVSRHYLPQGLGNATPWRCGHGGRTGCGGGGQRADPRAGEAATSSALQPQGAGCSGPGCLEEVVLAANWILHLRPQVRGLGPSGAGTATRVSAQPSSASQAGGWPQRGGTRGRAARGGARLGMGMEKQETAGRPPAPRLAA